MGIVLAIYFKKEGPQREEYVWEDEDDDNDSDDDNDNDNDSDTNDDKPYWDVPEPDKDELTVVYRFRRK